MVGELTIPKIPEPPSPPKPPKLVPLAAPVNPNPVKPLNPISPPAAGPILSGGAGNRPPASMRPSPAPTPLPSAPAANFQLPSLGGLLGKAQQTIQQAMPQVQKQMQQVQQGAGAARSWLEAQATEHTPPLSYMTSGLGALQQPANAALRLAQQGSKDPAQFAALSNLVAAPAVKGILGMPFGLPVLAGLQGLLAGGQAFSDAKTVFQPLLSRLG